LPEDIHTIIPHADFGASDCCGCLFGRIAGDRGVIVCNECGKIVQKVLAEDLQRTLDGLELMLEIATAMCRYCRAVNLIPGFSRVEAFVCRECGKGNG
jgi:hypothetical protein